MATQALDTSDPYAIPLDQIDVSDPGLFQRCEHWALFKRLREEDPVHYCPESAYGPYWSITKYQDIVEVDSNFKLYSAADGAVALDSERLTGVNEDSVSVASFISMDPPTHDVQRKIVTPAVAPSNIARLEGLMRGRTTEVLARLPIGEEFDWVNEVSIELTLLMLATLLDYPLEKRHDLKFWSDIISGIPGDGVVESFEQRDRELKVMAGAFLQLREERRAQAPGSDLISLLAHSPLAQDMSMEDYVANVTLLIVGGNDTTRNSMSAGVMAFHDYPDQWAKLKANPELVDSAVPETIRYHTPVNFIGRRAKQDIELRGKTIRKGDKIAMWYVSGNRDEEAIENADMFIIDRERPRQHLSFGFGIHRCLGNRLAEMQLRVLWEEVLAKGWDRIEVTGKPLFAYSNNLRGVDSLPVRIHA
jgi:cytochrome P450